ncbi:sporulation integral membrane protein YtvI [Virgibacillus byunsanensis]|uniref:Sporulation integral membrane protein YtvI n=1 Tax=Virgibacillus byunsanensis TaxID=570945 RepID=A0ABW3LIG0_9BACI
MSKQFLYQLIRFLFVIIVIVGTFFLLKYTLPYLYPLLFAIIFSMLLNPIVTFLEGQVKLPRALSTITVIISILVLSFGVILFIITELIQGTAYLAEKLPTHIHEFISFIKNMVHEKILPAYHEIISIFHTLSSHQQETINENIQNLLAQLGSIGAELLQSLLLAIPNFLSILPNSLTVFIFILLATFFLTKDWYQWRQWFIELFPISANRASKNVWEQLKKAILGFFKAQLILIIISTSIIAIGLLVLQIDHAITIALLAGVVDFLPLIGTGIIFIPWIVYLFVTADYFLTISICVLYMLVVITRQLLEPRIISSSIGINPLAALICLFISYQLWGVMGIIIAPILLVLLNVLYKTGVFHTIWLYIKG